MPLDPRVQDAMSGLAESLQRDLTAEETLQVLAECAADLIPGFEAASISVRSDPNRNDFTTVAATTDWVRGCDALQVEHQEGPCFEVLRTGVAIESPDVQNDPRWSTYGRAAAEFGVRSQAAVPVLYQVPSVTLNLYSSVRSVLDDDALEIAVLFASSAAITLGYVHELATLRASLDTRSLIGSAIGIVMERYRLRRDRAFVFLARVSQQTNVKLRDIAAEMVEDLEKDVADI